MQINEFKSIIETFSDPGAELLFEKSQILISVNDNLIDAQIKSDAGDILVRENDDNWQPATRWIMNRLAQLPLLAKRILSNVHQTDFFVSPSASLLPTLAKMSKNGLDQTKPITDTLNKTIEILEDTSPLETTVIYITSDAGEGKTSLINKVAHAQAERFNEHKSNWILVPIPLGGRPFLRFDDITIGVLQNRYRFQSLYYDSFLALVRIGVIVPAFDGFEEMFVENSSGEALSAMGILVASLQSQGTVVIAARKAYFEFENLRMQERLLDAIIV